MPKIDTRENEMKSSDMNNSNIFFVVLSGSSSTCPNLKTLGKGCGKQLYIMVRCAGHEARQLRVTSAPHSPDE